VAYDVDERTIADFISDAVALAFERENTRRQEDRDPTRLTMSGLGGCTRRNAYAVAGVEPSDVHGPEEARMALLGTGIHDWFLPAFAAAVQELIGAEVDVEKRVVLHAAGLDIVGHLDVAVDDIVGDLKTVREYKLHGIRRRGERGAFDEHQVQVTAYGLAEHQAGRKVKWIAYLYMDRTTGEVHPVVQRFTNEAALAVIDRVTTIRQFADTNPDNAPREARGPGLSLTCDRCPWLKRCWGPDAKPGNTGPQTVLAETPDGLIEILKLAFEASGVTSAAKADSDFAKLVLSATKDGTYGPFKLSRGKDSATDDTVEMKRLLTEAGMEIPKKTKAGSTFVRLAPTKKEIKK
jgi:hypothetical protein